MSEIKEGENQNNGQQNDAGKINKQYEANISKLTAVLGGKENLYPTKKVEGGTIDALVTELLKEQKEEIAKTVKTDLKSLLDKKVALDKEIRAKEDELKKLKENKQKEFNESCSKVFAKIGGIEQLEKDYIASLTSSNNAEPSK